MACWLAAALALPAGAARAQLYDCTVSASAANFGTYSHFAAAPLDTAGSVDVSCSLLGVIGLLVNYTIRLSAGTGGSYATRTIAGPTHQLAYNLYSDPARTSVWGDGSGGTSVVSDGYLLGLLTVTRSYPVYGRMPAGQNVPAGVYVDSIVATVEF